MCLLSPSSPRTPPATFTLISSGLKPCVSRLSSNLLSSSFLRIICSSPLSWKRSSPFMNLSLKKSSLKAESTPVLSMPNILGIIHLLGKMEGTSMDSDLIRSLAPLVAEELSFLAAFELLLLLLVELCCMAELADVSSIFISCSALFQKFCDSDVICCRSLSKSSHELRKKSSLKKESRRVMGTRLSLLPVAILICMKSSE